MIDSCIMHLFHRRMSRQW